jgi:hypothetical protein
MIFKTARSHRRQRALVHRPLIESLEQRRLLAVFANGIDSANLGKGMWAWDLYSAMHNTGFWTSTGSTPNYSGFFSFEKNTQGMNYVITKAADGNSTFINSAGVQNYTTTVLNAAHAAGLKILPYFYIYGGSSNHKSGTTTTVQGEIDIFNSTINTIGGDGAVLDIEGEYGTAVPSPSAAIVQYATGIGKSQAGDGSGSRDNFFIAYSSFPYVHLHTDDPFVQLGDYFDASMPQAYWSEWNTEPATSHIRPSNVGATMTPTLMIDDVNSEYSQIAFDGLHNIFYGHPESVKPVIITGMTFDGGTGGNTTTAAEITEFINSAKSSTTVPTTGPANVNTFLPYGYRGINFFDENSTSSSERSALASPTVAVLPGTPASPSPASGNSVASGNVTLDWADVVGSATTGAATSYGVYIDGVLKANVTASQYTVATALAAGAHTWQVKANDIQGTTAGPVWNFTVDTTPPTIIATRFQNQLAPLYLSFTFSEALASVSASNISITNLDTPGGAVPTVSSVQTASNTSQFFLNSNLPDGNFRATISGVTDLAGNALAGTKTFDFYFLRGDATADRTVNALDFNALATHVGAANAGFSGGDFNFDGTVNTLDFSAMAARWGTVLAAPSPSQPIAMALAPATVASLFSSVSIGEKNDPLLGSDLSTATF